MRPLLNLVVMCVFIFLGIFPLQAQKKTFKGEFYLGAGGGSLFSKVDFVPGVPLTFQQGLYGGVAAKYISEKYLGLITEINFTQRGWKEDFDPSSDFSYSRTINYIEIPLMTHVYFGKKLRFVINAGPQISLLVNDSQEMSQALADDLDERRNDNPAARIGMQYEGMSELKPIDYGLVAGMGMQFKTGIGDFDLEGRYYFGLGDIFNSRRSQNAYFMRSAFRIIEAKLTYYVRIF